MSFFILLAEALILAATLSIDSFAVAFSYGSSRIRIPFRSAFVLNGICCAILGISLFFGTLLKPFMPPAAGAVICFAILFLIGLAKLLDNITKTLIRHHFNLTKRIQFSLFNFGFILDIYANPETADADSSKSISPAESCSLAVALSLDGMAVGLGAALGNIHIPMLLFSSFFLNGAAILSGVWLGEHLARKMRFDLSWVSGAILIALAVEMLL